MVLPFRPRTLKTLYVFNGVLLKIEDVAVVVCGAIDSLLGSDSVTVAVGKSFDALVAVGVGVVVDWLFV